MRKLSLRETRATLKRIGIETTRAAAFAYDDPARQVRYDFHTHTRHQLLYSFAGTIHLETRTGFWMLPPQRAAWIPAGTRHATTLKNARAHSLYFSPRQFPGLGQQIQIIPVTPLLREMIHYAMQWPVETPASDRFAREYFSVLTQLLARLADGAGDFRLPRPQSRSIEAATHGLLADLTTASLAVAAERAKLSTRTFRRRFRSEMGMGWSEFVHQARLLQAMEWLTTKLNVTEVSTAVGFNSLSAFSKSFRAFVGENPLEFKHRSANSPPLALAALNGQKSKRNTV